MTVAELEAIETAPESMQDSVRSWRYEELVRAGFAEDDATEIAFYLDIDLREATALVRRGCPSATAARILC